MPSVHRPTPNVQRYSIAIAVQGFKGARVQGFVNEGGARVEDAQWNWVNIGWIRARPSFKALETSSHSRYARIEFDRILVEFSGLETFRSIDEIIAGIFRCTM